MIAILMP